MITFLLWILFGAFVGWLASLVMARDGQSTFTNIVVGVVGAVSGGSLLPSDIGPGAINLGSVFTAFLGAIIFLAAANLMTRGRIR